LRFSPPQVQETGFPVFGKAGTVGVGTPFSQNVHPAGQLVKDAAIKFIP
jgi:hypothetical protein